MKEFGKNCYDSFVYFNFDEEDELKSIFEINKNPQRIIDLLDCFRVKKFFQARLLLFSTKYRKVPMR